MQRVFNYVKYSDTKKAGDRAKGTPSMDILEDHKGVKNPDSRDTYDDLLCEGKLVILTGTEDLQAYPLICFFLKQSIRRF